MFSPASLFAQPRAPVGRIVWLAIGVRFVQKSLWCWLFFTELSLTLFVLWSKCQSPTCSISSAESPVRQFSISLRVGPWRNGEFKDELLRDGPWRNGEFRDEGAGCALLGVEPLGDELIVGRGDELGPCLGFPLLAVVDCKEERAWKPFILMVFTFTVLTDLLSISRFHHFHFASSL